MDDTGTGWQGQNREPGNQLRGRVLADYFFPFGLTKGQIHGGQFGQRRLGRHRSGSCWQPACWRSGLEWTHIIEVLGFLVRDMRSSLSSLHGVLSSGAQGLSQRSGHPSFPAPAHLPASSRTRLHLPALVGALAVSLDSNVSSYLFFILILPLLGFYYLPMTPEPCPWPGTIPRFS